jgi:hypothetical protein
LGREQHHPTADATARAKEHLMRQIRISIRRRATRDEQDDVDLRTPSGRPLPW